MRIKNCLGMRLTLFFIFFLVCFNPTLLAQQEHHTTSSTPTLLPSPKKPVHTVHQQKMKSIFISHDNERAVNLVVGYKMVNFAGTWKKAIAVNDQIPAPTLHFKEGDHVTINVYNHLNKGTSIHWHGVLVPWQMDGVEGVNQKAILPGSVFHYKFTLYQSGTYWYHAHAGLQEQDGLYGAFIIDPLKPPSYKYTKDYVIVLSDWNNSKGDKTFANLKKDGDYYSPRFPLQPSLMKFIHDYRKANPKEKKLLINDYKIMQQMRMSIYDISDVAYDAFLLNGQPNAQPWIARVKVGDIVRLRFIDAGGSTNFHVKIANAKMRMVHVQGNDVRPYNVNDFFITPGETYDVLVKIQKNSPYIIYAESADTLGAAYGALITASNQFVNYQQVIPFSEPKPVTREMMTNMMSGMDHESMPMKTPEMSIKNSMPHTIMGHDSKIMQMDSINDAQRQTMSGTLEMNSNSSPQKSMDKMSISHADHSAISGMKMSSNMKTDHDMTMNHSMNMPTEPTIIGDKMISPSESELSIKTTGTKYQGLTAAVKTNNPNKPVDAVIRMELFGYMDRFIWFVNGLPEYKTKPIMLKQGKRYRIIFTNKSMMHHPMHIHGHWFILRNGHRAYDPLLHTIDVPPGATVVIDMDADASGQWFFHCHHLYHMMAGMSRVFQYETIVEITKSVRKPQSYVTQTPYNNRPIIREDETMPIDPSLVNHPMVHPADFYFSSFFDVGEDPYHNVQEVTYKGLYGPDYNKLELFTNDAEIDNGNIENADMDIFYWHLISQFWAIKGGANYFYRPGGPYWQPGIGIEGLMPYFIDTDIRNYFHDSSDKLDVELSRDTQITNNFFIRLGIRSIIATKTVTDDEIGSGLNQMRYTTRPYYRLMPGITVFTEYEHDQDYGVFKNLQRKEGGATREDTVTFGFTFLF